MAEGVSDLDEENCFFREDMFLILVVFSGKKFWEKWGKFIDLIKISAILFHNYISYIIRLVSKTSAEKLVGSSPTLGTRDENLKKAVQNKKSMA